MTFDKKFVSLNLLYQKIREDKKPDQCSYLLAHDFLDENFTLALEPSVSFFYFCLIKIKIKLNFCINFISMLADIKT